MPSAIARRIAALSIVVSICGFADADTNGGGVRVAEDTDVFIIDCVFERNISGDDGGAIFVEVSAAATVAQSTFRGNEAQGNGSFSAGGAIRDDGAAPFVDECTFENNICSAPNGAGGAIFLERVGIVRDSTFRRNIAGAAGVGNVVADPTSVGADKIEALRLIDEGLE